MIILPKSIHSFVMSNSDSSYDSDSSVSSFEEPSKKLTGGAKNTKTKKTSKKATKTKKKSKSLQKSDKPKRKLNPIMARMNVLRNEHIGSYIGTKAPMKTIPPFKLVLAAARKEFKMTEGDKNTIEVVDKAIELFNIEPIKYCE